MILIFVHQLIAAAPTCPTSPQQWDTLRLETVRGLLVPADGNSNEGAEVLLKNFSQCAGAPACMARLREMLTEFTKPLAGKEAVKFTQVPSFLLNPKLLDLIDRKETAAALRLLRDVIAKQPGVPPLAVGAYEGTVPSPNGNGKDRLVIKYVDKDGTTKWINFASAGQGEHIRPNNISVIAHSANGYSYFQDYERKVRNRVVTAVPKNHGKDCLACHIQGHNSFPYGQRMKWHRVDGAPDHSLLLPENKGRIRPMGADGRGIRHESFGPAVDDSNSLGARRTDGFIDQCFRDIVNSPDPNDAPVKAELRQLMDGGGNGLKERRDRVRNFMNCGGCHSSGRVGTLPYPFGMGVRDNRTRFHLNRILDGSMPEDDYGLELTRADRHVLANCIFREQYGFAPSNPSPNSADIQSGRFYEHMAHLDCATGGLRVPPPSSGPAREQHPAAIDR